jgi:hypothetical protein
MKTLRLGSRISDKIAITLAAALGFDQEITADELLSSREAAFASGSAEEFAWHYLKSECFSKFNPEDGGLSLDSETYRQFLFAEEQVGKVNERLVDPWSRPWLDTRSLQRARAYCARVLGRFPWESFPRACAWSSGASTQFKRRNSQIENKWAYSAHITAGALPYLDAFSNWAGRPFIDKVSVVEGNKVTTVPKSYKINRTIAIEPDWNMFFQKGVGALIRSRLQRFGLLKPSAQSIARRLARQASVDGSMATLDLASASDMVSLAVCELLLPDDWFKVIYELSSRRGVAGDGMAVDYAKISSMGNGATFEVETLIFYVIAASLNGLGNDCVHVYGDDIIVPSSTAADLSVLLFECGFWLNDDKSFVEGPFRESCGGHYYKGTDVTPFYFRRFPRHVAELCVTGNAITQWCINGGWSELDEFRPVMEMIRRMVPRSYWGPYGFDGVLWSDWDQSRPQWSTRYQSWKQRRFVPVMEHDGVELPPEGSLLQATWRHSADWKESLYKAPLSGVYKSHPMYVCRSQWDALPVR